MSGARDPDVYRSIRSGPAVEIRVKGSRFAAVAIAVDDEREALAHLARIRRRDHDATHHGSAYRIGPPGAAQIRSPSVAAVKLTLSPGREPSPKTLLS